MMQGTDPQELNRIWQRRKAAMITVAGVTALNFFKRSFEVQGWAGDSFERWPARKPGAVRGRGRAILVDTGRLRRSIRITAKGTTYVVVGTSVPYARGHNDGSTITKTVTVGGHSRRVKGGTTNVRSHPRKMNLKLPKRRFIGNSRALNKAIARAWARLP